MPAVEAVTAFSRDHSIFFAAAVRSSSGAAVGPSAAIRLGIAARAQAGFSAGGLSEAAGAINASNWRAVRCRVPGYIEINRFAGIRAKLRLRLTG